MDINQASLQMQYDLNGKIEVVSRKKIETREDLSLAYTPGVAEPCRVIAKDYEQSFKLTRRSNLVAVITDGTAVLVKKKIMALELKVLLIQLKSSMEIVNFLLINTILN